MEGVDAAVRESLDPETEFTHLNQNGSATRRCAEFDSEHRKLSA